MPRAGHPGGCAAAGAQALPTGGECHVAAAASAIGEGDRGGEVPGAL